MNKLISLTGKSGCGKSTIEKALVEKGFIRVISHTTREPREGEVDGDSYHFISREEIALMNMDNKLAELTEYNGNYYAASIEELLKSDILVVEPIGLRDIRKTCKEQGILLIPIFIDVDECILRERMECRGDSTLSIDKRISADKERFGDPLDPNSEDKYRFVIDANYTKVDDIVNAIIDIYEKTNDEYTMQADYISPEFIRTGNLI